MHLVGELKALLHSASHLCANAERPPSKLDELPKRLERLATCSEITKRLVDAHSLLTGMGLLPDNSKVSEFYPGITLPELSARSSKLLSELYAIEATRSSEWSA